MLVSRFCVELRPSKLWRRLSFVKGSPLAEGAPALLVLVDFMPGARRSGATPTTGLLVFCCLAALGGIGVILVVPTKVMLPLVPVYVSCVPAACALPRLSELTPRKANPPTKATRVRSARSMLIFERRNVRIGCCPFFHNRKTVRMDTCSSQPSPECVA